MQDGNHLNSSVLYCLQLLEAALNLLDKLAAMDLVLGAKPIIAGRYSAVPWMHYMQPLLPDFT